MNSNSDQLTACAPNFAIKNSLYKQQKALDGSARTATLAVDDAHHITLEAHIDMEERNTGQIVAFGVP